MSPAAHAPPPVLGASPAPRPSPLARGRPGTSNARSQSWSSFARRGAGPRAARPPGRVAATASPREDPSLSRAPRPPDAKSDKDAPARDAPRASSGLAARRCPFPIEAFEALVNAERRRDDDDSTASTQENLAPPPERKRKPAVPTAVPTAGRFLWASRGVTAGTGLKPLDLKRDWLEQDGFGDPDAERRWIAEMRTRHALIDGEEGPDDDLPGCVAWDERAAEASEATLKLIAAWLVARQPWRYELTEEGGVRVPSLDGYDTGPIDAIKGVDALKTAAKLCQEELCLVRESTVAELWEEMGDETVVPSGSNDLGIGSNDLGMTGMDLQTPRHAFEAGVVCFSFDPRKRRGKTLAEVHRPVPGYEAKMRDAVAKVFANLDESKPLWRANWALQNSPEVISTDLEWHPTNRRIGGVKNRADAAKRMMIREKIQNQNQDEDDDESLSSTLFADAEHTGYMDPLSALPSTAAEAGETMHLRVEYETIRRLPGPTRATSRWILFTVRTHVGALDSLDAGTAAALRDAIEATGEAELAYKSLADETLRRATVAFLEQRSEGVDEMGGVDGGAKKGGGVGAKKGGGVAFAASVDVEGESTGSSAEASSMNNVVATGGPTGDAAAEPEEEVVEEAAAAARPSRAPSSPPTPRRASRASPPPPPSSPQPLLFEASRAASASRLGLAPWPSSALGLARASAPPASWYAGPGAAAVAAIERDRVFRRGWCVVGAAADVAEPGARLAGVVADVKFVVVRGEDGALRAFHNACAHKGAEVVSSAPRPGEDGFFESLEATRGTRSNAERGDYEYFSYAGSNETRTQNRTRPSKAAASSAAGSGGGSFWSRVVKKKTGGAGMNDAEKQASSSEKKETCGGGSSAACLRCPYHGWTYDLTGRLVRASRLGGTEDFDAAENGLVPLAAETLGPFVFLYVGTEARNDEDAEGSEEVSRGASRASRPPSFREWLGEAVASELELAGIIPRVVVSEARAHSSREASDDAASDATRRSGSAASSVVADDSSAESTTTPSMTRVARREFSVACNWKVFCDNYLDGGYHVPFAHPALAEGVDMRTYRTTWAEARGHATQTVGGGFRARGVETGEEGSSSATTTTVSDDANGTSRGGGRRKGGRRKGGNFFDGSSRKTRGSGSSSDDDDDPGRLGDGGASYVFLYPNFMINRYGPWMDTNLVVPTGPETCVVVFEYWLETERLGGRGAERFVAESLKASELVQREDEWLCEKVQEGMRSPVWRPGRYVAAVEGAMYNFHRKLWEDMTDDE